MHDLPRTDDRASYREALLGFIREHHITHLMLMQAPRSRWDILLHGSTINYLLRHAGDVDLYVMPEC